jgi:hypothetical protein
MRFQFLALSSIAAAIVVSSAAASEFQVLGSKALSMGGAGVAMSPAALAAYNNPALLGFSTEKVSIHIGAGIGVKDTGAGKSISDLNNLGFTNLSALAAGNADNLTASQISSLEQARSIILGMNQKGIEATPNADLGIAFGGFGTGLFVTSDIGGVANIDQTRTDMIFETSTPGTYLNVVTGATTNFAGYQAASIQYAIDNGLTNVNVKGLAVGEVPLAYGHAFTTQYGQLAIGGALKLMQGETFYKTVALDNTNTFNNLNQNTKTSTTYGVDLGLAFKPDALQGLTIAASGKNLNRPEFNVYNDGKFKLDPAARVGAAYKVNNVLSFVLDTDLTENKSINGYKTRYVGGGTNIDLSFVELNLGLMKNVSSADQAGVIYTAGVATGPSWLHFELSAQMASKSGEVDGNTYPKQAAVNLALSSSW